MKISFLEAAVPLVKSFRLKDGKIEKSNYPMVKNFTSHTYSISTIQQLYSMMTKHAAQGHCMLKGEIQRELDKQSRANSTSSHTTTRLAVFDLDGISGIESVKAFIAMLPKAFRNVTYIVQYSASMGITGDGLRAHIFFVLTSDINPNDIKKWVMHFNLTNPTLVANLRLSRTGNAILWALDVTINQNDKLVFLAPPVLGKGVEDGFIGERISIVKKAKAEVDFDFTLDVTEGELSALNLTALNRLRGEADLRPKRSNGDKVIHNTTVAKSVTPTVVTGVKSSEDFVYLNINGGDSWGYYHPTNNATILFNFKGEPNYLTRELLPEYWTEARQIAEEIKNEQSDRPAGDPIVKLENDEIIFSVIDDKTDEYLMGTYDEQGNRLEMSSTRKMLHVKFFYIDQELDAPTALERWQRAFLFDEDFIFDEENRRINTYRPTELMMLVPNPDTPRIPVPKTINRVILHACGSDPESAAGVINWLAYIVQYRCKSGIAWVFGGTQGTGKGILFNNIISPIFGAAYTPRLDLDQITNDKFNRHLEQAVFALVDEAHMEDLFRHKRLDAKIRELITEPTLSIRPMGAETYKAASYINVMFASNENQVVHVPTNDRRFSVATRQEVQIVITPADIRAIESELPAFVEYLKTYEVDVDAATTPLDNEARRDLQELSRDSNEELAQKIVEGDFGYLFQYRPLMENPDPVGGMLVPSYHQMLIDIFNEPEEGRLSMDQLYSIFYYINGIKMESKVKFGKFLRHRGFRYKQLRVNGEKTQGIGNIHWNIPEDTRKEFLQYLKSKDVKLRKVKG